MPPRCIPSGIVRRSRLTPFSRVPDHPLPWWWYWLRNGNLVNLEDPRGIPGQDDGHLFRRSIPQGLGYCRRGSLFVPQTQVHSCDVSTLSLTMPPSQFTSSLKTLIRLSASTMRLCTISASALSSLRPQHTATSTTSCLSSCPVSPPVCASQVNSTPI